MDQIKIGKFIASLRKEHNMTQLVLAEKLGISDRAISKWENGRGLPDISLMKPLCVILGITLDELLCGERVEKSDSVSATEKNLLKILLEREAEIRKSRRRKKILAVLLPIVIAFVCIFGLKISFMIFSGVSGEGSTFYTAVYTLKAEKTVNLIRNGEYEKAVKYIGFENRDRAEAQNRWVEDMESVENMIDISYFEVSDIILDDRFPVGDYIIVVSDRKDGTSYLYEGQVTIQDGGIAFGGIYLSSYNKDVRRQEIAGLIETALCSWYAG